MSESRGTKHANYELLNLIGYGLSKFNRDFVAQFGFDTKTAFYQYIVDLGVCDTVGTVKNRQDLLDPFFDNGRRGWWQRKQQYISRKLLIDSLFGEENVQTFADIVKLYFVTNFRVSFPALPTISPIIDSRFRHLQETGAEAELYFYHNYQIVPAFEDGIVQDARQLGDGYDFQIEKDNAYYLAEVKGVRLSKGNIRMTNNEYQKALAFTSNYFLVVVSNLVEHPRMTAVTDPANNLKLTPSTIVSSQMTYSSESIKW